MLSLAMLVLLAGMVYADGPGQRGNEWDRHYTTSSAIAGTVSDDAAAPLAGAIVTVARIGLPGFTASDTSDATGKWLVARLMAGNYLVKAAKSGYLSQYYINSETQFGAKLIALAQKDTVSNVQFALAKGATISGTVYVSDNVTPLAGAEVTVYRNRDLHFQTMSWAAKTDEAGKYSISGLQTGGYLVKAAKQGYTSEYYKEAASRSEADTVKVTAPEEKSGIDFSLAQTNAITGVITAKATGEPIANAWIAVYNQSTVSARYIRAKGKVKSDSKGAYAISVEPGSYLVAAEATGYAVQWFDKVSTIDSATAVVVKTGEHSKADFSLGGWGTISGIVLDEKTSAPIAKATIHAYNDMKGIGQKRSFSAVSADDGTFSFAGLPSGSYILDAQASGYVKEYWQEADSLRNAKLVTVKSGVQVKDIRFTLGTGGSIQGNVTDAGDHAPMADVLVQVQSARYHTKWTANTDASGNYNITGLKSGSYVVSASISGYVSQWYDSVSTARTATKVQVVAPKATDNIDFALTKIVPLPRSISGLVVDDSTGLPLENAVVKAIAVNSLNPSKKALTAGDGTYVLRGLADGSYILLIHAVGYQGEFYDNVKSASEAKVIQVVAGTEVTGIDIGLSLQKTGAYHFTGCVKNRSGKGIEGALVALKNDDETVAAVVTAEDGTYSIESLPADSYTVSASTAGAADFATTIILGNTINVYSMDLTVTNSTTDVQTTSLQPAQFELAQNYPNPFNPSTQISFSLAQSGLVQLTVYDVLGREVKRLVDGEKAAGTFSAMWDGTNSSGEKVASGIYFYRMQFQGKSESYSRLRRMLFIK
jgi:hypothetical protein